MFPTLAIHTHTRVGIGVNVCCDAWQITDVDEEPADQHITMDDTGLGKPCAPPKGPFSSAIRLQGCVVVRQGRWHTDSFWTVFPDEAARLCTQLRFFKERHLVLEARAREAAEAAAGGYYYQ